MEYPTTPKRQDQSAHLGQPPTPPSTVASERGTTSVVDHRGHRSSLPIRCRNQAVKEKHQIWEQEMTPLQFGEPLGLQQAQNEIEDGQNQEAPFTLDGRPESDIEAWTYSATSAAQRRQRFLNVLHATYTYPSNDEFNAARQPFYDPEEDGPYDNDDYNPYTDHSKSTEVWQPKIGDEGIDNEEDLRMVLKARKEHEARSKRFRKHRALYVSEQLAAGVKFSDIDMIPFLLGPKIQPDESDESRKAAEDAAPAVTAEEPLVTTKKTSTATNLRLPVYPALKPIFDAKGIRVFGGEEPRRRSKNKKGRKSNKRKRGPNEDSDGTYKYDGDSEDERPARKKKALKGKRVIGDADATDVQWRPQTRAAARRKGLMGTDGSYDEDTESSLTESSSTESSSSGSGSETDWSSDSSASMASPSTVESNEDNEQGKRRSFLSRFTSFFTG